jgi:hypothetical protein
VTLLAFRSRPREAGHIALAGRMDLPRDSPASPAALGAVIYARYIITEVPADGRLVHPQRLCDPLHCPLALAIGVLGPGRWFCGRRRGLLLCTYVVACLMDRL